MQMDLEEWELLSEEGLIDHHQHQQQKMIYPRSRRGGETARSLKPAISKSNDIGGGVEEKEESQAAVVKELLTSSDHLLKKKDTEFADKTQDLSSTPTPPPPPPRSTDPVFVVEEENEKKEYYDANHHHHEERGKGEEEVDGGRFGVLSLLKMGKSAVCTFGIAACATVCVLVLGGRTGGKNHPKLHFQIYTDDKRIKQAAERAAKLNDAISAAARGGGARRQAQITTGAHYESL